MEVANASFTLTKTEFLTAVRYLILHRRRFWIGPALGAFLIADGLVLLGLHNTSGGWLAIWFGVVFVAVAPLALYRQGARQWDANPSMQVERVYRFTDERLEVTSSVVSASNEWVMYDRLIETKDFYALRMAGSRASVILPKRGFETAGDEEAFRRIVSRRVSRAPMGSAAAAPSPTDQ